MVAGRFDPALARLLPANPIMVRNPVFQKIKEIVTRFGDLVSETAGETPIKYSLLGKDKSQGEVTAQWQDLSTGVKKLRTYAGETNIVLPDAPSLRAVFKTQEWPSNYKMTYFDSDTIAMIRVGRSRKRTLTSKMLRFPVSSFIRPFRLAF